MTTNAELRDEPAEPGKAAEGSDSMVTTPAAGAGKALDFAQKVRVGHHQAKVEQLCAQLDDVKRQALALAEVVKGRVDGIVAQADQAKAQLAAELEAIKGQG